MQKFSVLITVYYKEKPDDFRTALNSIINQTVTPDEIVLVEDGPLTDELYKVVEEFKSYLNVVVNEKNMGSGLASKIGLQQCKNELVARMDSDDISCPDRFEKQLKYFDDNPSVSVLGGQIVEFMGEVNNPVSFKEVPLTDKEIKKFMKKRNPVSNMTVMFKKSAVLEAGGYQDFFLNEDYYLWIRLALCKVEFANLPDVLVYVRIGNGMHKRRGGKKMFASDVKLQKYMFDHKFIGFGTYLMNCIKRLIVVRLLPASLRSFVYKKFARKKVVS